MPAEAGASEVVVSGGGSDACYEPNKAIEDWLHTYFFACVETATWDIQRIAEDVIVNNNSTDMNNSLSPMCPGGSI